MGSTPLTYGLPAMVSTFLAPLANEKSRNAAFFGKDFLVISPRGAFLIASCAHLSNAVRFPLNR